MRKKDKQPEDAVPSAATTGLPQAELFQISSEQAGQTLRWLAEDIFRRKAGLSQEGLKALSPEEMQHMLYELRVHQIELEIQNEELLRIQAELAVVKDRYFRPTSATASPAIARSMLINVGEAERREVSGAG
jgi:hypothetical protein